jgi:two-component system copper resistance phosphate regulon response regulator CusR
VHILVIEDEPRIRAFLGRALVAEGFVVDGAEDGLDGLKCALAATYDLIVLDLLLPRVDGLTVLRELTRRCPDVPVVVVSARTDLDTKLRGVELGARDDGGQPVAGDELAARVRVQLRGGAAGGGAVLHAGGIALDLMLREARLDGHAAELSDREFRVLRYLIEHAGEVVSRESILSAVWGYYFDPRSNVVDVCVRRLRRKLGSDAPIETVRHAGYRISAA